MTHRLVALGLVGALAGCGHALAKPIFPPAPPPPIPSGVTETRDEAFRSNPPVAEPRGARELPAIQEARLRNGLRVLLVENHQFPIAALRIVVARGAAQAPPGVAALLADVLVPDPSGIRSVSDDTLMGTELQSLGARYEARASHDAIEFSVQVPRTSLGQTLALVSRIIRLPKYTDAELERAARARRAKMAQQRASPSGSLGQLLPELAYPAGHPYRFPYGSDGLPQVTRGDLERFVREEIAPDDTAIVVAGDTTLAALLPMVNENFAAWQARSAPVPALPAATRPERRVVLLDHPGESQANIGIGCIGLSASSSDSDAFAVANAVLSGWLWLSLREAGHYTYSAQSSFDVGRSAGLIQIRTPVEREHTRDALRAVLAEIDRIRTTPVVDAALRGAKAQLIYRLVSRFETVASTADALAALAVYAQPIDEYSARVARIGQVTAEQVQHAALAYLAPETMQIAIVGDARSIAPQLEGLGLPPREQRK